MAHFLHHWGYLALLVLTVAEAACIPIPSEVTVGYAGYLASTGRLNLAAIIVLATAGETVGAYIAYVVGRTGGRAFVDRFGRYVLLSHADLDRAEHWFDQRGEWSVAVGRVVPLIRTFIAFPAGVAEMAPVRFGLLTAGGSLVWIGALAGTGYALGNRWNKLTHGFNTAGYVIGGLVVVAVAAFLYHRWRRMRAERRREPLVEGS
ncbi:MAG TPA: DedA family protein [Acidimicrobiales bacterium]|nr:DedA family protein [Acidimicrobiales bacterium]